MLIQFNPSRRASGRVRGGNPPFSSESCLRLNVLHGQARISLFNLLNFLNETARCILLLN